MTTEAPHTTGLFAELLEGAKALAERPTLIAKADEASAHAQYHADRADRFAVELDSRNDTIQSLREQVRALEEANAAATFREKEVGDKLAFVASAFKSVLGDAGAALDLIEPKPEPVPVDPTPATTAETPAAMDSASTSVPSEPIAEAKWVEGHWYTGPNYGGHSVWIEGHFEKPSAEPAANFGNEGQSVPSPTAPSTNEQSAPVDFSTLGTTASDGDVAPKVAAPLPKPYWEKPNDTSWDTWIADGNEAAPWLKRSA